LETINGLLPMTETFGFLIERFKFFLNCKKDVWDSKSKNLILIKYFNGVNIGTDLVVGDIVITEYSGATLFEYVRFDIFA
jgi:hypothetical protein